MGWKPVERPKDKRTREWGLWMLRRKARKSRLTRGTQRIPPAPLTKAQRAARDVMARGDGPTMPPVVKPTE